MIPGVNALLVISAVYNGSSAIVGLDVAQQSNLYCMTLALIGWIYAVVVVVAATLWRWRLISRTGRVNWRAEVPFVGAGLIIVVIAGLITISGPLAQALVPPLLLIPISLYLLARRDIADVGRSPLTVRNSALLTLVAGVLGAIRGLFLLVGPHA